MWIFLPVAAMPLSNSNRSRREKFLMRNRNLEGPFHVFGAV